jgi:hypothetical protein
MARADRQKKKAERLKDMIEEEDCKHEWYCIDSYRRCSICNAAAFLVDSKEHIGCSELIILYSNGDRETV